MPCMATMAEPKTETQTQDVRKSNGYWSNPANLKRELLDFIATTSDDKSGNGGRSTNPDESGILVADDLVLPSSTELKEYGRVDLIRAIAKHGGFGKVAHMFGFLSKRRTRIARIQATVIRSESDSSGGSGSSHSEEERDDNMARMDSAIHHDEDEHLNSLLNKQLGISTEDHYQYKFLYYAIRDCQIQFQLDNKKMPSRKMFEDIRRGDCIYMIRKLGGFRYVARTLDMTLYSPRHDWRNRDDVKQALVEYAAQLQAAADESQEDEFEEDDDEEGEGEGDETGEIAVSSMSPINCHPHSDACALETTATDCSVIAFPSDALPVSTNPSKLLIAPTSSQIAQSEYSPLLSGLRRHGGIRAIGEEAGLIPRKPQVIKGYWKDIEVIGNQLQQVRDELKIGQRMPKQRELVAAGRSYLVNGIRLHGGFSRVASLLNLVPCEHRRTRGHWDDFKVLRAELTGFINAHGYPGLMPNASDFRKHQRHDLIYAIEKHGGFSRVSRELHCFWHGPYSFWKDRENLSRRLGSYMEMHKCGKYIPSLAELQKNGRYDLVFGIALHGGYVEVAKKLRLRISVKQRTPGFWKDPRNVETELREFLSLLQQDSRHTMPSSIVLVKAGRADLAYGIRDCGGWVFYAQRLGIRFSFPRRRVGFWNDIGNVKSELLLYIKERGLPKDQMPSLDDLKLDGRSDIAFAIQRYHGGQGQFCRFIGLKPQTSSHRHSREANLNWLSTWSNYNDALRDWIKTHGFPDIMPGRDDFISTGRHDLRYATFKHGGCEAVARKMGLVYVAPGTDAKTIHGWLSPWLGLQASKLVLEVEAVHNSRKSQPNFRPHLGSSKRKDKEKQKLLMPRHSSHEQQSRFPSLDLYVNAYKRYQYPNSSRVGTKVLDVPLPVSTSSVIAYQMIIQNGRSKLPSVSASGEMSRPISTRDMMLSARRRQIQQQQQQQQQERAENR